VGLTTVSEIVAECVPAIVKVLSDFLKCPNSVQKWQVCHLHSSKSIIIS
jgi:hypothetical protein